MTNQIAELQHAIIYMYNYMYGHISTIDPLCCDVTFVYIRILPFGGCHFECQRCFAVIEKGANRILLHLQQNLHTVV